MTRLILSRNPIRDSLRALPLTYFHFLDTPSAGLRKRTSRQSLHNTVVKPSRGLIHGSTMLFTKPRGFDNKRISLAPPGDETEVCWLGLWRRAETALRLLPCSLRPSRPASSISDIGIDEIDERLRLKKKKMMMMKKMKTMLDSIGMK